jgi:hypothetical protein
VHPGHRGQLVPGPDRRFVVRPGEGVQRGPPADHRVTGFREGNDDAPIDILQITNEDEGRQLKRLGQVRQDRDQAAVDAALAALRATPPTPRSTSCRR